MLRIFLQARSTRPTIGSRIREAVANGRILFRALIDKNFKLKSKTKLHLSQTPEFVSRTTLFHEIVKNVSSFKTTFFRRIRTRWIFNTFAANLRRSRAKEYMYLGRYPLITFIGLSLAKGPTLLTEIQELEGISWEIRDAFASVYTPTSSDADTLLSAELKSYQLGDALAKGCNAVVYSAHRKSENEPLEKHTSLIERNVLSTPLPIGSLAPYDIAVKMMFNYEAESNAVAIWKAMNKEILPAKGGMFGPSLSLLKSRSDSNEYLPPHPNIVDMHFAFADRIPLLPEAMSLYPEALPAKLYECGYGRNMTLFIVMKRYHCTLFEYLQLHNPSYHTSLLLFTQLLEGIVHLNQHQTAHRDLKLDNILIDLSKGLANPQLVITDFGCCLPSSNGLQLPFYTEELCRGGNIALMAPEVINAKPGLFSVLDYSRADLWTVGTLAFDIFGGKNPFYSNSPIHLRNDSYDEKDIPPLSDTAPPVITKLVKGMLQRNFRQRPSPSFAATVCQLLVHLPCHWLRSCYSDHKKVLEWLVSTSGITIWQMKRDYCNNPIEQQLRATFLSRVHLAEVMKALQFIADD